MNITNAHKTENSRTRIKVLSLHWGFGFGGIAKYSAVLEKTMETAPIEIYSICILTNGRTVDEVTLKQLSSLQKIIIIKGIYDFSWLKQLNNEIKIVEPHCIFTHGFNGHFASWLSNLTLKISLLKIASYHGEYHGVSLTKKIAGFIYDSFTIFYLKNIASHTVAVADDCKHYLIRKGIQEEKITTIHNGIEDIKVNVASTQQLSNKWHSNENMIIVGVIARLEPIKGVDVLIEALALAVKKQSLLRLIIVGDGPQKSMLEEQVKSLNLTKHIMFLGYRTDIPEIISALDVFILPSHKEAHSIGLLEAMRAGKPIIATHVGGNTESARPNEEALIIPPNNALAIAQAIEHLISNPELRNTLGKNARERFQSKFTLECTIKKTSDWLLKFGILPR